MKRRRGCRFCATTAAAGWALLGSPGLQAAEWSVQGSAQGRARYNLERPDASTSASSVTRDTRLTGAVNAARALENSATKLDATLDLPVGNPQGGRTVLGRLALGQTLAADYDILGATLEHSADENQSDQRTASDALIGRRRRSSDAFVANWQHAYAPRLSAQADVSAAQTRYSGAQPLAQPFRNVQASATLSYLWDERTRLGVSASRSRYTQSGGDQLTTSDSLQLNLSRSLSEITSLSLSLGGYRTLQQGVRTGLACPLPVAFCTAGLVAPVLVQESVSSRVAGSQYSLGLQSALDETRGYKLAASRQLSPSGLGVLQADSLSAALSQAVSPQLNLSFSASHSRSRIPGTSSAVRPALSTLDAALNWNLQERLSLSTGLTLRRLVEPAAGLGSRSVQFSISLQYQAPKILATR